MGEGGSGHLAPLARPGGSAAGPAGGAEQALAGADGGARGREADPHGGSAGSSAEGSGESCRAHQKVSVQEGRTSGFKVFAAALEGGSPVRSQHGVPALRTCLVRRPPLSRLLGALMLLLKGWGDSTHSLQPICGF